jgi:site-specific DNA recombinase
MQTDDINAYCAKNNLVVRKWYIDTATSASKKAAETRDAFFELIQDIKSGDTAGTLLVYSTSRAFRNSYESHKYRKFLRERGIKLISATQHIDEETSSGRLTTNILADIDQYKAEELSDYVSSAMRSMVKRGFWTGAPVPLGYKVVPADDDGKPRKKYAIDDETAEFAKEAFQRYIDGEAPVDIARRFNRYGLITSKGNPYNAEAVRCILYNDFYTGTRRLKMKGQDELIFENSVPAIIDKATFALVQKIRVERRTNPQPKPKTAKSRYLLTGKIICGECAKRGIDGFMIGNTSTTPRNGKTYYHFSYMCNKKRRYKDCQIKNVRRDDLETFVLRQVKENILHENIINQIADEVLQEIEKYPQPVADEKTLKKRKGEILKELVALAKMKAAKEIDDEVFALTKKEYDDEKAQIEIDLYAIEQSKKTVVDREFILATLRAMIADIESGDHEVIKALLNKLVESIVVTNDKVVVNLVVYFSKYAPKSNKGNPKYALGAEIDRNDIKR